MKFRTRAVQALKRRLITRLGCVSDQKFHLDSLMVSPRNDVERIGLYSEATQMTIQLPVNRSKLPLFYQPRRIYRLTDAIADPLSGLIYDAAGQFVAESSSWLSLRQLWSWPRPYIKVPKRKLHGNHVFLPVNGYFHWLLEDLAPVIDVIEAHPDATIVVPANPPRYVTDFLKLVSNRVVYVEEPMAVESLILVAKIAGYGLSPHPRDFAVLRRFFAKWMSDEAPKRKLYLSRVGERRSPGNEPDLLRLAVDNGYEVFNGNGVDLLTQVSMFSSAKAILGVHGAAFTNLAFSRQGRVCELFNASYLPACYSILAQYTGLDYHPLIFDRQKPGLVDDDAFDAVRDFFHN